MLLYDARRWACGGLLLVHPGGVSVVTNWGWTHMLPVQRRCSVLHLWDNGIIPCLLLSLSWGHGGRGDWSIPARASQNVTQSAHIAQRECLLNPPSQVSVAFEAGARGQQDADSAS